MNSEFSGDDQLGKALQKSLDKLKACFDSIFLKYGTEFPDDPVIDVFTETIVEELDDSESVDEKVYPAEIVYELSSADEIEKSDAKQDIEYGKRLDESKSDNFFREADQLAIKDENKPGIAFKFDSDSAYSGYESSSYTARRRAERVPRSLISSSARIDAQPSFMNISNAYVRQGSFNRGYGFMGSGGFTNNDLVSRKVSLVYGSAPGNFGSGDNEFIGEYPENGGVKFASSLEAAMAAMYYRIGKSLVESVYDNAPIFRGGMRDRRSFRSDVARPRIIEMSKRGRRSSSKSSSSSSSSDDSGVVSDFAGVSKGRRAAIMNDSGEVEIDSVSVSSLDAWLNNILPEAISHKRAKRAHACAFGANTAMHTLRRGGRQFAVGNSGIDAELESVKQLRKTIKPAPAMQSRIAVGKAGLSARRERPDDISNFARNDFAPNGVGGGGGSGQIMRIARSSISEPKTERGMVASGSGMPIIDDYGRGGSTDTAASSTRIQSWGQTFVQPYSNSNTTAYKSTDFSSPTIRCSSSSNGETKRKTAGLYTSKNEALVDKDDAYCGGATYLNDDSGGSSGECSSSNSSSGVATDELCNYKGDEGELVSVRGSVTGNMQISGLNLISDFDSGAESSFV
ncbi:hypothetical protein AYI69_g5502 [Smittium culicis]|uniref:Uncharacterized protein n=1 Tax=Smittium culicis TaxID=133412 RepID=A0A1R1Y5N3_9FUNG|nr:hypothetical protein AYI69_g5502 [Smittium culicis]